MRSLPMFRMINPNYFAGTICAVVACSASLAAFANPAPTQDEAAKKTAAQVLDDAIASLTKYSSIQADLHETVSMGTRRFTAKGSYVQGPNNQLRLNLEINPVEEVAAPAEGEKKAAPGDTKKKSNSVLQVSDGRMLWTQWTLDGKSRVERRDIQEITKALAGSKRWTPQQLLSDMGLGGVPALLTSMKKRMVFKGVRTEEIDGKPFVVIQGRWNQTQLRVFNADPAESDPILESFLPEYVRIFFEKESLFPCRIMFLKRHPNPKTRTARPLVTLDLTNRVLNGDIDPEQFRFDGNAQEQTDITEQLIQALKGTAAQAEQMKAQLRQQQQQQQAQPRPGG